MLKIPTQKLYRIAYSHTREYLCIFYPKLFTNYIKCDTIYLRKNLKAYSYKEVEQMFGGNYREYFIYLEKLRRSGITNMYEAVPYLMEAFPYLTKTRATNILIKWMQTYNREDYKNIE